MLCKGGVYLSSATLSAEGLLAEEARVEEGVCASCLRSPHGPCAFGEGESVLSGLDVGPGDGGALSVVLARDGLPGLSCARVYARGKGETGEQGREMKRN